MSGPYKPTTILVHAVEATDNSLAVAEHTTLETPSNMSPENKAYFLAEKEAIHLILTGIKDEIYSTVDACQMAQEIWEPIERLQQGESLNIHDVKTNLFWEFRKFTSHDGESMESYYTRFYKLMNEMIRNNLTVTTMQRDKDMQKNLDLIAKYFKKIYKPTKNNLRTSSNIKNKNVDTTSRFKNDNQSGQFGNQRMVNVVAAMENVGSKVVQQSGIQCFNCKEYGHFAKEYRKPKRVKDSAYHKEKMLLCKQAEQGVLLQAEQYDYLKQAQSEIPCLYTFPYDQNTHTNRLIPDEEETLALERENRSKLNKDLVHPYDYTKLNSLYEIFKPPTHEYETQLTHANEIRIKMRRKCFVKSKSNIYKNVGFLPVSKSISKRRQAYNVMTNNINHFKQIVDDAWIKHSKDLFRAPTAHDMEILIQTCLMPLAIKTQSDSLKFIHELKQEMHTDLKYVESLEKEIDELESDKAEFSDMYDVILQECVSKDVMCSYLMSLSNLDALDELQCMYLHKVKECDCLAQKFSKQTEFVSKKNIAISELKKLIEKGKGKYVDTKFDRPSVVRQPNVQRISKPSVLGKPTPFSDSPERRYLPKTKLVSKANVSKDLSKPVTVQTLPQTATKALSKKDIVIGLPKLKYVKDQLCSSCELSKAKRSSFKSKAIPSSKG
nr:hypothetical protein [Tanacetum cinerariifolium]